MNAKMLKILAAWALGLQAVALVLATLVVICQRQVKELYAPGAELQDVTSFPVAFMTINMAVALLYFILLVLAYGIKEKKQTLRTGSIVLFAAMCLLKTGVNFLMVQLESVLVARKGVMHLAGLNVLNNAVNMVTGVFTVVAFGLFCMAVGVGVMKEVADAEDINRSGYAE